MTLLGVSCLIFSSSMGGCTEGMGAPPPPPPGNGPADASVADADAPGPSDADVPAADTSVSADAMPPIPDSGDMLDCPTDPRCVGAAAPAWALEDIQPASARAAETYGLDAFRGSVTVLSFHAGWCGGCVVQIGLMQELFDELLGEGYTELQFVSVNALDAMDEASQQALIYRRTATGELVRDEMGEPVHLTTFPIFQDVPSVQARTTHLAHKNDFFIYDREGRLSRYMNSYGPDDVWLDLPTGRGAVRTAITEAYGPLP